MYKEHGYRKKTPQKVGRAKRRRSRSKKVRQEAAREIAHEPRKY
jgi:hypothetical protein